jgi:TRAP-type C4-dicarboxylate transport system substrate-binding protein
MRDITLNIPTDEIGLRIWAALRDKFPEMRAEEKGFKVLARSINTSGGNSIHTTGKQIKVPKDMKGTKIIATGEATKTVEAAGGSAISLGSPDWYMSLERKLGDGLYGPYNVADSRGCIELLPYHLHAQLGRGNFATIMNQEKWNTFPPDIQKIIEECGAWYQAEYLKLGQRLLQEVLDKCKRLGQTVYQPTPEELQLWRNLGTGLTEDWIKKMEPLGKPAKAVYEEAQRLTKEYVK